MPLKVIPLSNRVELILSRHGLMQALVDPNGIKAAPACASQAGATPDSATPVPSRPTSETPDDDLISIHTASGLEPSGNGHRLVIKDASYPKENMHLALLIGEAFALREALLNGPHDSIEAMSNVLQRGKGYIHARIRLTYLSPAIIKNILNGNVPASVSATKLLEATKDLPVKWAEQDRFIEALAR